MNGVNVICKDCLEDCKQYKQITLIKCPFFHNKEGVRGYIIDKRKKAYKDTLQNKDGLERLSA